MVVTFLLIGLGLVIASLFFLLTVADFERLQRFFNRSIFIDDHISKYRRVIGFYVLVVGLLVLIRGLLRLEL